MDVVLPFQRFKEDVKKRELVVNSKIASSWNIHSFRNKIKFYNTQLDLTAVTNATE